MISFKFQNRKYSDIALAVVLITSLTLIPITGIIAETARWRLAMFEMNKAEWNGNAKFHRFHR